MDTIYLKPSQDGEWWYFTAVKGPKERKFATIEDLSKWMERATINPYKDRQLLVDLVNGIPIRLLVTPEQYRAFYS